MERTNLFTYNNARNINLSGQSYPSLYMTDNNYYSVTMLMAMKLISKVFFFSTIATLMVAKGLDKTFMSMVTADQNNQTESCSESCSSTSRIPNLNSTDPEYSHANVDLLVEETSFLDSSCICDRSEENQNEQKLSFVNQEKTYPICSLEIKEEHFDTMTRNSSAVGVI